MKNLYSANVDQSSVDNLSSGTLVTVKVVAVDLAEGQGLLKRGTLLTTLDGEQYVRYEPAEPADPDDDEAEPVEERQIHAVLLLDVDTDDADECTGPAAFSGEFNQNKIEEVMATNLTPLEIANARARQLYIAPMEPAPAVF